MTDHRLEWTTDDTVTMRLPLALDDTETRHRREALDQDDTAGRAVAALARVLDAMGRMRHRHGPHSPHATYEAAQQLMDLGRGMQAELMMSTMVSHGYVADVADIPKSSAQYRRDAARRTDTTPEVHAHRWPIGYRPAGADAREWYVDAYPEDDEESHTGGTAVVNLNTGTTGIQTSGPVTDTTVTTD